MRARCMSNSSKMLAESITKIDGTAIRKQTTRMQGTSSTKLVRKLHITILVNFNNDLDPYIIKATLFISVLIAVFGYDLIKDA